LSNAARVTAALPKITPLVLKNRAAARKALFAAVEAHDLEGIGAKRKRDPYGRGAKWWQIKNPPIPRPKAATRSPSPSGV
jgi:hypothetical protein